MAETTRISNTFLSLHDKVDGESIQKGKEKWIEIHSWTWDLTAESSWTKGGGASVGKPVPGRLIFEHYFDTSSPTILGYICTGKAFPKATIEMMKTTGKASPETYLSVTMEGCFITGVSHDVTEEGYVMQRVAFVFKTIKMEYKPQNNNDGSLGAPRTFTWDIPAGTASPSA